jgi:hypothetical protein
VEWVVPDTVREALAQDLVWVAAEWVVAAAPVAGLEQEQVAQAAAGQALAAAACGSPVACQVAGEGAASVRAA